MTVRLLTVPEAAAELGVKPGSLRSAAERHGLLIRMGRAVRIDPATFPELIEKCRDQQKAPASSAVTTASGTSATKAESSVQRALATAEKLKRHSRATSPKKAGQLVQLHRSE